MLNAKSSFLLFLMIFSILGAQCPVPKEEQTRVYSDVISVIHQGSNNDKGTGFTFSYTFEQSFNKNPSSGFGINQMSSESTARMQIKIVGSKTEQDHLSFIVNSGEQSKWKSLKINFITTTRSDIEIGTSSFEPGSTTSTEESFQIAYPIQKEFSSLGLKVKPFLQSFDIQSDDKQSLGVKLDDADIQNKKVYFSFANPNRVSIVRSLTICVIIFNTYTPGVLYADGIIDQNFVTSRTELTIPRHGISELRTYIVGINSFHASAAQEISISSAIDETFTLVIGPINRQQVDFISVSYLILSIVDCGSCEGNPILYENICQPVCPRGFTQRNGKCVKIICPPGEEVNSENQCVKSCGENEDIDNDCACLPGYFMVAEKCIQCPEGTLYNPMQMTCDSLCGQNSYFSSGRCFCNPGYYVINNRCQSCPKGTRFDGAQRSCVSVCNVNEVYNGQKCVCSVGYNRIEGVCGRCPLETIYNSLNNSCECLNGKQWKMSLQRCIPICTSFEVLINQKCECKDQYVRILGVCGACPQHSFYFPQEQKCHCKFGFRQVNGFCECPFGHQYNQLFGKCVKRCTTKNEVWNGERCDCRAEETRDSRGICFPQCGVFEVRINEKCTCIQGYYKGVYGPCIPIQCPAGNQWDPVKRECRSLCPGYNEMMLSDGECVCVPGFERQLIYGICLPDCPLNQVRSNGRCVCSPGNKIIDGRCTQCPRYQQYVNGICLCYNGNHPVDGQCQQLSCPDINHVYDSLSRSCRCKGPLVWMRGRCEYIQGCGVNQYWCGTACVCHYGYVKVNGQCTQSTAVVPKCPPYSQFDPVLYRCVCTTGYYPVRQYVCQKCPTGSYWDGYKCNNVADYQCAQGYTFDGISCVRDIFSTCGVNEFLNSYGNCVCKSGYFWINAQCTQCSYGTYFDGSTCASTHTRTCSDSYKFWNGAACVCLPDFFEYGNTCVRCPANTVWNGFCCKIPSYIGPLNVVNGY